MVRNDVMGLSAALALVVVGVATSVAQAQDCDGWVALHDILPTTNPVMVKTGANAAILYGGVRGSMPSCETWTYDGTRWRFVTLDGPSPRYLAAGAYDSVREELVLFGGNPIITGAGARNETWVYNDGEWTLRTPAHAPSARASHAMVFDPSRSTTFLYGGQSISTNLFWAYDGTDWSEVSMTAPNPGAQVNPQLVFDPRDNSIVLIPNVPGAAAWKWNGSVWSQLGAPAFQPNTAFFDAELNTIVIGDRLGRFFAFDGTSASQLPIAPSPVTTGSAMPTAIPMEAGYLTILGPYESNTSIAPDYLVSQEEGWRPLSHRPRPNTTEDIAFAYFPPTHSFVLFGGRRFSTSQALNETWILRGQTWRMHTGPGPAARYNAHLGYLPDRESLVMLGGSSPTPQRWTWSQSGWSSTPTGNVSNIINSPMALDASSGVLVWPTDSTVTRIGDTIVTTPSNVNTRDAATAFDPVRGLVSAGGQTNPGDYRLVSSGPTPTWEPIVLASAPRPRWGSRMSYDPDRSGLVLFGGFPTITGDVTFSRRTYFLGSTANSWTTLPFAFNTPTGRKFPGMDYDPVARRIVMYGGLTHGSTAPLQETWKLARGPAAVALEPSETYVVPGETAEVFIIASGGGVIDYQWFKDGQPLANSARISGADSDTLQIQNFTSDDNGEYHVTVGNPCGQDQSVIVQVRAIPACPGDFNDSGGVDATDLADFFDAYERGLMLADVDLSGGVDAGDIAVFIGSFETGGC